MNYNKEILKVLKDLERGSTSAIRAYELILKIFSAMVRSYENDKRGFDSINEKVVKYAYVDFEDGCVYRADGYCVGNYIAGDFQLNAETKS